MRDYAKFFTPPDVAKLLVEMANIKPFERILEPHAGDGRILKEINRAHPNADLVLHACEIDERHLPDLKDLASTVWINDYLKMPFVHLYDKVIANPPFGNETDFGLHFQKMRKSLRYSGKMVTIAPLDFGLICDSSVRLTNLKNWSKNSDGTVTQICILTCCPE